MNYKVEISKRVSKEILSLPKSAANRIMSAAMELGDDPRPSGSTKMKGTENEYRIRVGDYRVVYEVNDDENTVTLISCKHRKDIYRK